MIKIKDFMSKIAGEVQLNREGIFFGFEFLNAQGRGFYDQIFVRKIEVEDGHLMFSEPLRGGEISDKESSWFYDTEWFVCGYRLMSPAGSKPSRLVGNPEKITMVRLVYNEPSRLRRENFPVELQKDEVLFFQD